MTLGDHPVFKLVIPIKSRTKRQLQRRAEQHGRNLGKEAREILGDAVEKPAKRRELGSEIASLFSRHGFDTAIPELRGTLIKPGSPRVLYKPGAHGADR